MRSKYHNAKYIMIVKIMINIDHVNHRSIDLLTTNNIIFQTGVSVKLDKLKY